MGDDHIHADHLHGDDLIRLLREVVNGVAPEDSFFPDTPAVRDIREALMREVAETLAARLQPCRSVVVCPEERLSRAVLCLALSGAIHGAHPYGSR